MPQITVLDQSTIDKIAAGEVIERPSSVVKELLENAIDAQATAVTVEIRDGGTTFIRVTDNGCGIPKDQVALAFLRHSTSKIQSAEDLFTVSSLGFRGEALSSIAAVSQVELITKTPEQLTGVRYVIEGGKERSTEEIGAPDGTTFLVRNLFYNTPARQKFLKTAQTEGSHVADLVEKIAMSHPDISIRFIQNNQNKLHTSGNHNLKDIIYTVFGREIAGNLLQVEYEQEILQIRGFAGKPVIARSNRNFENYYINGRYVKSQVVAKAIEEAYRPFMMQHKYPFILLHIRIEPEYLDVNVHPTKMELRFREPEQIYQMIYMAVSEALAQKELIPQVELEHAGTHKKPPAEPRPEPFEVKRRSRLEKGEKPAADAGNGAGIGKNLYMYDDRSVYQQIAEKQAEYNAGQPQETFQEKQREKSPEEPQEKAVQKSQKEFPEKAQGKSPEKPQEKSQEKLQEKAQEKAQVSRQLDFFEEKLLEPKNRKRHKLIGQLFDTYWLVEFNDHLYIIDQHAAHEKVLYERTMKSLKSREYTSQMVNPPIVLTLGSGEQVILKKYMKYFTDLGFEIEHFGGKEYAVRAVPDNLFSIAKKDLLMEMLDDLSDDILRSGAELIYDRVATMSCKAAVKGNNQLSHMEADHLIDELLELDNPYACPHGRPTIISMSRYELEKKFKRIV